MPPATSIQSFSVEWTPRGGHFIRVVGANWVGLYRLNEALDLVAHCLGLPPAQITPTDGMKRIIHDIDE